MNNQHYYRHYKRLTTHITYLSERAKQLEFVGAGAGDPLKFRQQLREYKRQIGLYLKLRQILAEKHNTNYKTQGELQWI